MATRTAWAQISQSIPSVFISTWSSSARAGAAASIVQTIAAKTPFISPSFEPEEVADVDRRTIPFGRTCIVHALIDRKEHAARHAVGLVQEQRRRPHEHGARPRADRRCCQPIRATILTSRFDEKSQIRLACFRSQRLRAESVDDAREARASESIAAACRELLDAAADPEIM